MKHKYLLALVFLTLSFFQAYSQNCKSAGCATSDPQVTITTTVSDAIGEANGCYNLLPYKVVTWEFFYSPAGGTYTQTFTPTSSGDPLDLDYIVFDMGTSGPTSMVCPVDPSSWTQVLCNLFSTYNTPTGPGVDGTLTTTAGHFYAIGIYVWQSGQPVYTFSMSNPQINGVDLTALNCPGVLPVKLSSFDIKVNNCMVKLDWVAESESNFSDYQVEYSTNGTIFQNIATIPAQAIDKRYSWQHNDPAQGKIFYRLKMTDIDGRIEYSKIIALNLNCGHSTIYTYPNPVTDILHVNISNADNDLFTAMLIDMSGKIVYSGLMKNGSNNIDMTALAKGIYILRLKNNAGEQNMKIIK